MELTIDKVVAALQYALERHNPKGRVVAETDADPLEGQTYRMHGERYHSPSEGRVFRVNAQSSLYAEFPDGFALYEVSVPQAISDTGVAFTIRVGKIGEAKKERIRIAANAVEKELPNSDSLQRIYDNLRKMDNTLPEYHSLSEAKLKIFISQIVTLRMTMKM